MGNQFFKTISATGYRDCDRVSRTFLYETAAGLLRQVEAWAEAEGLCEWSLDRTDP